MLQHLSCVVKEVVCAEIRPQNIRRAFNYDILLENLIRKCIQLALEITTDRLSGLVELEKHDKAQEKPPEVLRRSMLQDLAEQHFGLRSSRLVADNRGIEVHLSPLSKRSPENAWQSGKGDQMPSHSDAAALYRPP